MFLSINTKNFIVISGIWIIQLLGSCADTNKSTIEKEDISKALAEDSIQRNVFLEQSKIIGNQVNTTLVTALTNAIGAHGLEGAVDFCSLNAVSITDSISTSQHMNIQRISHKARNQNNEASAIEKYIISQYALEKDMNKTPIVLSGADGYTFYAPIYIAGPLCLNCHGNIGTEISEPLNEHIKQKYPNDKATGFELNEIRGLLRIKQN
ncbi:MAG: DUF3365 domain-containing protein [Crocinitomicaceae bacterium]|nr:DUF3365 domain-containing protein [Crocinitomicaceae bacterium]MBK8925966.1 DUF3365 domain-containing protein [Crocinitomicaceae bacterium]